LCVEICSLYSCAEHESPVISDGELHVLLAAKSHSTPSKLDFEANEDLKGLTDFLEIQVPKSKPITRAQYEVAKSLWPTQFHEDKR